MGNPGKEIADEVSLEVKNKMLEAEYKKAYTENARLLEENMKLGKMIVGLQESNSNLRKSNRELEGILKWKDAELLYVSDKLKRLRDKESIASRAVTAVIGLFSK
jgi:plasmid replication initiation protein